jgi:serine/threonine protein kinase
VVAVKVISAKRTLHPGDAGDLEQQLSMELARHEYESWINANLRHPNIMQLFTSFTVCLDGTSSGSSSSTEAAGRDLQPRQLQQQQQQQQLGSALSGTSPDASGLAPAGSTPAAASASSSARSDADAAMPAGVVSTGVAGASDVAAAAVAASTSYKWKTHLVMEYCDMGTLQVSHLVTPG